MDAVREALLKRVKSIIEEIGNEGEPETQDEKINQMRRLLNAIATATVELIELELERGNQDEEKR